MGLGAAVLDLAEGAALGGGAVEIGREAARTQSHGQLGVLLGRPAFLGPVGGAARHQDRIAIGQLQALEIDAANLKEPTEADVEQIRGCLQALLDVIAVSIRVLRHRALASAPPPSGDEAVRQAAQQCVLLLCA